MAIHGRKREIGGVEDRRATEDCMAGGKCSSPPEIEMERREEEALMN